MNNKKELLVLLAIILLATILRFYNLMHDAPFFFDPDERNMASAITRFILPAKISQIPTCLAKEFLKKNITSPALTTRCSLNPHFFAYGQFPLYLSYLSDQITKPLYSLFSPNTSVSTLSLTTSFKAAIFWLRFWSTTASVLTVLLIFLITKKLFPKLSFAASFLTAVTPGLIQAAHFGTTESLLTFFFLAVVLLSLKLAENFTNRRKIHSWTLFFYLLSISFIIGLSLGSKLTGLLFFFPALIVLFFKMLTSDNKKSSPPQIFFLGASTSWKNLLTFFSQVFSLISLTLVFFILSSPYNLVEFKDFQSAVFGYEQDVAIGRYDAFYTRQFVNTTPILFQLKKIFPSALGWPQFILGSIGFLLVVFFLLKKAYFFIVLRVLKNKKRTRFHWTFKNTCLFLISSSFLVYLIPNAFLFAKWTRFMTPIFPFFTIFAFYVLLRIEKFFSKEIYFGLTAIFITLSALPGVAFMSIYSHQDTRVTASYWIYDNIPSGSYVLSETANVVDIPLGIANYHKPEYNLTVISFDFYHLDQRPELFTQLLTHLAQADYILIPSRRIFKNYLRLPHQYPLVTKYYQLLFSGRLGFEKVTEISSFPTLSLGPFSIPFPDEDSEETFTVFDHPVIRIYQKVTPFSLSQYQNLLKL